jgi:hypothetical protein
MPQKIRSFIDFAVPVLRRNLSDLGSDLAVLQS